MLRPSQMPLRGCMKNWHTTRSQNSDLSGKARGATSKRPRTRGVSREASVVAVFARERGVFSRGSTGSGGVCTATMVSAIRPMVASPCAQVATDCTRSFSTAMLQRSAPGRSSTNCGRGTPAKSYHALMSVKSLGSYSLQSARISSRHDCIISWSIPLHVRCHRAADSFTASATNAASADARFVQCIGKIGTQMH